MGRHAAALRLDATHNFYLHTNRVADDIDGDDHYFCLVAESVA